MPSQHLTFFRRSSKFSLVTYTLFQYSSFSSNLTCTHFRHLIQIILPLINIFHILILKWMIKACLEIFILPLQIPDSNSTLVDCSVSETRLFIFILQIDIWHGNPLRLKINKFDQQHVLICCSRKCTIISIHGFVSKNNQKMLHKSLIIF